MIKEQFEEQKYLQFKDFLNEDEKNKLTQVIEELENHKFCNKTTSVNNQYVENTGRTQAILFSENFNTQDKTIIFNFAKPENQSFSLSRTHDINGKRTITSSISQFITGYADVTKEDFVFANSISFHVVVNL